MKFKKAPKTSVFHALTRKKVVEGMSSHLRKRSQKEHTTHIKYQSRLHSFVCHPDDLSVERATQDALTTWNLEPLFHLSIPIEGWDGPKPERHHDYINVKDFADCWRTLDLTVEVEAKAKELAVLRLKSELEG